ncbi:hypothetical protein T484DRAFT_1781708 [Baffinella frigidus]|nr:hypothetical protein T484DRAFT_1781708 [Cryptophyta sp. CCMP2293]
MFFLIAMCDRPGLVTASTGEPHELPAEARGSLPGQCYARNFTGSDPSKKENREDAGTRPGVETDATVPHAATHRFALADTRPFVSAGAVRLLPDPLRLFPHGPAASSAPTSHEPDASTWPAPTSLLAIGPGGGLAIPGDIELPPSADLVATFTVAAPGGSGRAGLDRSPEGRDSVRDALSGLVLELFSDASGRSVAVSFGGSCEQFPWGSVSVREGTDPLFLPAPLPLSRPASEPEKKDGSPGLAGVRCRVAYDARLLTLSIYVAREALPATHPPARGAGEDDGGWEVHASLEEEGVGRGEEGGGGVRGGRGEEGWGGRAVVVVPLALREVVGGRVGARLRNEGEEERWLVEWGVETGAGEGEVVGVGAGAQQATASAALLTVMSALSSVGHVPLAVTTDRLASASA